MDTTYPSGETYNGERQVIKTLTTDPLKLYTDIKGNFDALKARAEALLFGGQDEVRRVDLIDKMKQKTQMPWLPPKGIDALLQEAYQRGLWEDMGNGYVTKAPKPKNTSVLVSVQGDPDDKGQVRLKIETVNAGSAPRVHYASEDAVSEQSPVLKDSSLITAALRVRRVDHEVRSSAPDGYIDVCAASDIPDTRAKVFCIAGERLAVFRYDGKISAVSSVCQHQNGPLGEGRIIDGCITCPWHGYQYYPDSGQSPAPFTERIPTFNVRIVDGRVQVDPRPNTPGTSVEPATFSTS